MINLVVSLLCAAPKAITRVSERSQRPEISRKGPEGDDSATLWHCCSSFLTDIRKSARLLSLRAIGSSKDSAGDRAVPPPCEPFKPRDRLANSAAGLAYRDRVRHAAQTAADRHNKAADCRNRTTDKMTVRSH